MGILWAVHISDGVLQWPWLVGGFALAGLLAALGCWRLRDEEIPRIAVMSSAFFVSSLIHVPLVGTSVHLLLNGLVGIVLGLRSIFAIAIGLVLQALLFGHGGLSTLGVNTCVMALPALGAWLIFQGIKQTHWLQHAGSRWMIGFLIGGWTVLATAGLNFMVLLLGGVSNWPALATAVFVAHLPVAGIEALVMAATISFLYRVKPEMLGIYSTGTTASQPLETAQTERQAG